MKYPNINPTPRRQVIYDNFLSVNYAQASANLPPYHAADSLNMIRDEYGKVRKRLGYYAKYSLTGHIYGMTKYAGDYIIHAGTKLLKSDGTELYSGLAATTSQFHHKDDVLYVLDGTNIYTYNGTTVSVLEGKIPRITIGGAAGKAGTAYQQVNMISNKWEEGYAGDGTTSVYYLSFGDLDATLVEVEINGIVYKEGTVKDNYKIVVDRSLGRIVFDIAQGLGEAKLPPAPSIPGQDNVIIRASKDRSTQRNKIFKCTICKPFGVNGYDNQLFLAGNPDYPNYVFWCGVGDLTYWGDLQYAILGQDDSSIMSISSMSKDLLIHKDTNSGQSYLCNVFLETINALLVPQIRIDKVIHGAGAIGKYTAQQFGEPLYLSQLGLMGVTYRDLSSQEIETIRGDRVNRKLLQEANLDKAISCVYKYYYLLAVNGNVYVLDRLNPQGESNVINNAYQYNAFIWDNIPATCFYVDSGNKLLFGTTTGHIMEFYTDDSVAANYNDNGVAYNWYWEFPEYVGNAFYSNKSIKYIALRAKAYSSSTVKLEVQLKGLWYEVLTDNISLGYLDLDNVDLSNLNLSTDTTPKKITEKYNERKLDKFAFRISGDTINEQFGLYSFAFEVKEKGKNKD